MVALAIPKHTNWRASDMELRHEAVSYTVDTLEKFGETLVPIMNELGADPGEPTVVEIHNMILG